MALALFDFDGTITKQDSGFHFILYSVGWFKLFFYGIWLLPFFILRFCQILTDQKIKELVFSLFFKGWEIEKLQKFGDNFGINKIPLLVRKSAIERIDWHKKRGDIITVVSASSEIWLQKWCNSMEIGLIASKMEVSEGKITGKLIGKNCKREEKVSRIKEKYDISKFDEIYAYGDSIGDKEMLAIASNKFYRYFKD